MVAGRGFEPPDLRVMSPTSYQAAPPRDINFFFFSLSALLYYTLFGFLSTYFPKKVKFNCFLIDIFLLLCYNIPMKIDLSNLINKNSVVAVAVSGGSDSMALLYYMQKNAENLGFSLIALNVEHGIRGAESINDSNFVKSYCIKHDIPLLFYAVDSITYAKQNKLSLEQSARILRYNCFYDALSKKKCDIIATAHHLKDNAESVLFNLFRGTGIKGITGIEKNFQNKIIRPFLEISKQKIDEYVMENKIPFVTDKTNFDDNLTRNNLRLNVIPKIKEIFPKFEESVLRFSLIAKEDEDFIYNLAYKKLTIKKDKVTIKLPIEKPVLSRAVIIALQSLGLKKDWEKVHIDCVSKLITLKNGAKINLPKNIEAIKEYDKIVFYVKSETKNIKVPFSVNTIKFGDKILKIEKVNNPINLKDGLYLDRDKIPNSSVIRSKCNGDEFTKFGGGTKKLNDYLTDKKIPLRLRNSLPLLADGNKVLAIFGLGISDLVKVDQKTKNIIKIN